MCAGYISEDEREEENYSLQKDFQTIKSKYFDSEPNTQKDLARLKNSIGKKN